ncbi:MAG: 50S ribosomal protein L9 [Candidatus Omnitrophica bacterium]|nr:50S ribosomal protein L9 [Candidatus Omnitrophota bacterium]
MNVILMKNIEKLGQVGDVVKVKDGYARNYLLPRQLGMPATPGNIQRIEKEKAKRLAEYEAERQEALKKAEALGKVSITIAAEVNEQEQLYGAVSESDILEALEAQGQKIDRRSLVLEKPVDALGDFEVGVKLHPQVIAKIRLWVTKKADLSKKA